MVYCGKPSKGCALCRAKRTKCDQARPSCGQCRRAQRNCPGYRDEQDTVFRNETSKVITKVKASSACANGKLVSSVPLVGESGDSAVSERVIDFSIAPAQSSESASAILQSLSGSLEDEATYHFFYNYLSDDPSADHSRNAYSSVLPILHRQDSSFGVLPKIVNAIGLASISNMKQSPEVMVAAGQRYAGALRAINSAIQNSSSATTDQTLMAVMLLGVFETITCSHPESMRSWANHINGASAIARLRGTDQLRTKIGRTIFAILRVQILIDCLQRRSMVPPDFIDWAEIAAEAEGEEKDPEHQLFVIIGRLCALRATADRSHSNSTRVVTLANLIDSDLEQWKSRLPPDFLYSISWSNNTEYVFSGTYHVYNNTWAVGVLNLYRCARILTHEVIRDWLRRDTMPNAALKESQRRQSKDLSVILAHEICASVPFILGASESSIFPLRRQSVVTATGLLWPLYLAATMDLQNTGMRTWIVTRLGMIGLTMGVKQAESLALVLRTKGEITAWDKLDTIQADEVLDDW